MNTSEEITNVRPKRTPDATKLLSAYSKIPHTLAKLGFSELRKGQIEAVNHLLAGNDALVLLPTGEGKSAIYIVTTDVNNYRTVVFSPLVALMQDQTASLQRKGFRAAQISSIQESKENEMALQQWAAKEIDYLIVTPERLSNEKFLSVMTRVPPDMTVIDEAHTLSQWSDNFRPDYCKIGAFIEKFDPKLVLCLTATCPAKVEEDVRRVVGIPDALKVCHMTPRTDLKITTKKWANTEMLLKDINSVPGSTIVYCATVKMVEELYAMLDHRIEGGAVKFHGELTPNDKSSSQNMFMSDTARVIFCTNSFGMGIDKASVRGVFHRDMPGSLEAYSQEIGRGSRDGKGCKCILYMDDKSIKTQMYFLDMAHPDKDEIVRFYNAIKARVTKDNMCVTPIVDIAKASGIRNGIERAILSIMYGACVLERTKDKVYGKVKLLQEHIDPKVNQYFTALQSVGVLIDGYYEFNFDDLALELGTKPATIRANIRDMAEARYLEFIPPPRLPPIKIIGDLSLIDFERLRLKAIEDNHKFGKMMEFVDIPDDAKHKYMIDYFTN
jgi:ATP-dependent DNA helicase RecQ